MSSNIISAQEAEKLCKWSDPLGTGSKREFYKTQEGQSVLMRISNLL